MGRQPKPNNEEDNEFAGLSVIGRIFMIYLFSMLILGFIALNVFLIYEVVIDFIEHNMESAITGVIFDPLMLFLSAAIIYLLCLGIREQCIAIRDIWKGPYIEDRRREDE